MNRIQRIKNTYYAINILYNMGIMVFGGTLYLYMKSIHYSYADINLFLSIFWIVGFITEIPSGVIADTFGRKKTLISSCVIRSIGLFLLFFDWGNMIFLILSAVFTSLGESLRSGTVDSWMIDSIHEEEKDYPFEKVFSNNQVFGTTFSLLAGYVGAQVLGNIDLSYPVLAGAILLLCPMMVAVFFMKEPASRKQKQAGAKAIKNSFHMLAETMKDGFFFLRKDKGFFLICLSFLPLSLIVTGPFNQWQLFFQEGRQSLNTGYILIGVNLFSILGAYFSRKISALSDNKIYILIGSTLCNTLAIIMSVIVHNYLIAISVFLLHVMITASEEIIRYTFLNQHIKNENRSTLLSFFNTLEAGTTVIALSLNGLISNLYGIGPAWVAMSVLSIIISIPVYLIVNKVLKHHGLAQEKKVVQ